MIALLAVPAFPAAAGEAFSPADSIPERIRFLSGPARDPLAGFDATTMAWHSAVELLTAGGDALTAGTGLDNSIFGRSIHTALTLYFCEGMNYYSHEIAHRYLNRNRRHFWIDPSDWSKLVPRYVEHELFDAWDPEEFEYYQTHPHDSYILNWFIRRNEAGFFRNRLNSRSTARMTALTGSTTLSDGMAFYSNAIYAFEYIHRHGDDPITYVVTKNGSFLDINDVNGYVYLMNDLGIEISQDTWLMVSGLSAAFSGQLWNSLYGAYRYIVHEERVTRTIEFGSAAGLRIAPPNFYLFPTVRGLYLETETYLQGLFDPDDLAFVSFGTGLDRFGLEKTGPVDQMRIGAMYHPAGRFHWFGISPFLYLDFMGSMKQIGHSVGAAVETVSYRRFYLTATLEHNRGDMIEQTIKFKDDGFYFIAGLGFRL